jgi:hypothetical protein
MALKHTAHNKNNHRNREDPPSTEAPPAPAANNAKKNTANNSKKNAANNQEKATNVVGNVFGSIVQLKTPPYNVTRCDQVVMFDGQTLAEKDDYSTRKDAFFTINAYMVNMFESKDSNKLLESINISHIKDAPAQLLGALNCYAFGDQINLRTIEMCFKTKEEMDNIVKAYHKLMECRFGGEVDDFEPTTINKILTLGCNGIESSEGVEFDLPEIRKTIATELKDKGVIYIYYRFSLLSKKTKTR